MKVLIADKLSPSAIEALGTLGIEVESKPDLKTPDLPGAIGESEVLIVRSTKVDRATIDAGTNLGLIVRAGAGVNTIDLDAASERGVYVANCPGKNCDAVAELAIGLLLAADRRIPQASADLAAGAWKKKEYGKARGLKGRTLGILGLGMIGQAVLRRARGLEMEILAWSRSLTPERAEALGIERAPDPLEVARRADAVTLHLAATDETRHLVGADFLEAMRDGAILVNTSRGEVVDTAALKEAIRRKHLRVGLDVYENEPAASDPDFADTELAELVVGTPHIGASTDQAAEAIAAEAVRVVKAFLETGVPANAVNLCERTPATHNLIVRHYNRVGVLAGVLQALREDGVNIEEMNNIIFDGGKAACCTLQLDSAPSGEALERIRENEAILQAALAAREA
jgi:D-3-phosphoglycerate dehydrogenase / 2-oxoglutarate reductase